MRSRVGREARLPSGAVSDAGGAAAAADALARSTFAVTKDKLYTYTAAHTPTERRGERANRNEPPEKRWKSRTNGQTKTVGGSGWVYNGGSAASVWQVESRISKG